MSALTDPSGRARAPLCPWQQAGLLYLVALLAGLAAGLWPETLWPAIERRNAAPLPTLHTLAVAQLLFFLLVYPMVLLKRFSPRSGPPAATPGPPAQRPYWRTVLPESLLLIVVAGPFYLPAAFLADATATDALRVAFCVASFLPLAWLAGAHFVRARRGASAVTLALLIIALALPAASYIAIEFLTPPAAHWTSMTTPALIVWRSATARVSTLWTQPLWTALAWPALAAVIAALGLLVPAKSHS